MTVTKYSKPTKDIFEIKKSFISKNEKNLNWILKVNKFYNKRPKRDKCKNCNYQISKKDFLIKNFNVNFYKCKFCDHINGASKDDLKFNKWLYQSNSGKNYGHTYFSDYKKRVKNIYLPKVKFLKKVVKRKISLLDIGSGAGHFLKALEHSKIPAYGIEPNKKLVKLGNSYLKSNKLIFSSMEDINNIIRNEKKSNVLSLIGVLEHLNDPNGIISTFYKSKIKYLFLTLPLFSISSYFENNYKNVFPRVLSGAHTHLYTKKSIEFMIKKNKLKILGSWWFGSDIADLYRMIIVTSNNKKNNNYLKDINSKFLKMIDDLQHIIDKNKECNEVHLILKKI